MSPVGRTEGLLGSMRKLMVARPVCWFVGLSRSVVQTMFFYYIAFLSPLLTMAHLFLLVTKLRGWTCPVPWHDPWRRCRAPKPHWMVFLVKSIVLCLMNAQSAWLHFRIFLGVFLDSKSFNTVSTTTNPWSEKPGITLTDFTKPGLLEQNRSKRWSQ